MQMYKLILLVILVALSSTHQLYCPSKDDIIIRYNGNQGSPQIVDQGWTVRGGGGVTSKAAFNLIGGWVEYDVDFTDAKVGVNANIYTISPKWFNPSGYTDNFYCDGNRDGDQWCIEVDWFEANGNCAAATTLHTVRGNNGGCDKGGCGKDYWLDYKPKLHMKITYDANGNWKTYRDGQDMSPSGISWNDREVLKTTYEQVGAVIVSTQWVGWVPMEKCGPKIGDLDHSVMKISNLRIYGSVKQGPEPRKCQ